MKFAIFPFLILLLFSYCNLNLFPQQTNNCPQIAAMWTDVPLKYAVSSALEPDTVSDSFANLSVGNRWTYDISTIFDDEDGGQNTYSCESMDFQIISNAGNIAVLKLTGQGTKAFLDTLHILNDSIYLLPGSSFEYPILLGLQKNIYPCYKFNDSNGFFYGYDSINNLGLENAYLYIRKIGMAYSFIVESSSIGGSSITYCILSSFNGVAIPDSLIYEGISKIQHFRSISYSIRTSTRNTYLNDNMLAPYIAMIRFNAFSCWMYRANLKNTTLPFFPKKQS